MTTLAERIKELRIEKELTQKELANILNLQNTAISKYELGERTPDKNTLVKLSNYFGISLDYLMGASNVRNPYISVDKTKHEKSPTNIDNIASDLQIEYLQIAKELQENNISIEDIRALIDIVKRNRQ